MAMVGVVLALLGAGGAGGHRRQASISSGGSPPPAVTPGARASATTTGSATTPAPAAPHGAPPARSSGPYRVGRITLMLAEPSGAGVATAHSPSGQPERLLSTVVRYPKTGTAGPFPLVVFSQGYDVSAEAYSALLTAWARAGYVVADPTYPLTDPAIPPGVNETDIVNHPADLRFVISALGGAARDPHSPLHGLVDPARVGIVGHSDGGDVSLAAAANSCCRDPAVNAAAILSGAELSAFGGTYYGSGSVPLLVVQGSADTINVPGCSAQLYDQAPAPKYYLGIPGAEHQPPYVDPGVLRALGIPNSPRVAQTRTDVARAVIAFFDAYLKGRRSPLAALSRAGRLAGGETITSAPALPGAATYCPGAP